MKVAFAGTPEFARVALEALIAAGHDLCLVLTQPDRQAGRGMQLQASPVKAFARGRGIPLVQPRSLRLDGPFAPDARQAQAALLEATPQVLVVAAYGLLLPPWVLALPPAGCLNIHGSLLPRWRGAAPIQRAIEAGDALTGITIMRMDAGLDTGPMLLAQATPIAPDETAATLHDRLAALGASLIVQALAQGPALQARAQPLDGVTYARKIDKAEAVIDWRDSAVAIERRLRAFDPFPGCSTTIAGHAVKVWRARVAQPHSAGRAASPGSVLPAAEGCLVVACGATGQEALELLEVQAPGGRRGPAREWLQRVAPRTG